jgi:hypothetical protein
VEPSSDVVNILKIGPELAARMTGVSWHEGCPVPIEDLRLLDIGHVDFEGRDTRGQLVIAASVAEDVAAVFQEAYNARFPIERMELSHVFGGKDEPSMAANNTSGFSCRPVTGGKGWSAHALGLAIDINPRQNPYVRGEVVLPKEGRAYLNREDARPGMVRSEEGMVQMFRKVGWTWGGSWNSLKDYQHFSATGR